MAFFKFRKGGDESPASPAQAETVEDLRRRARHRLTGAAVLVGIGVIGFPLLFDTQPRPVAVDIPIEIPDRAKAKPLPAPAQAPKAQGAVTDAKPAVAPAPAAPAPVAAKPASATVAKAEPAAKPVETPKPEPVKPVEAAKPAPVAKKGDGDRAAALLEGKPSQTAAAASAPAEGRFIVQVGAFSDPAKVRDTRQKVEKAGLKTYTQVADSDKLTRVRVGPFPTRAEAEKAASKIKELDLQARILTL